MNDELKLIRISSIKQCVKELSVKTPVKVSADFIDTLNDKVMELLDIAIGRCNGNNRKTLRPVDL